MSLLLNLLETYNSNLSNVGVIQKRHNQQEYTLLPISHTTQTAHIEVNITEDGNFHSAALIPKGEGNTLIPCTENSASRAGAAVAPYPLHDKLSYVAGDFVEYGGQIKGNEQPFEKYIEQLGDWAKSDYAIDKVRSIYQYLSKGQLIKDIANFNQKIIALDSKGKLISKWEKKYEAIFTEKPQIFSIVAGGQEAAFVRFNVHSPKTVLEKVWNDKEMYQSFIDFYSKRLKKKDLCYVTGKKIASTDKHANKIRNSGDKAKLISANDTSGFTFRGRFNTGNEVACISYEASQKAHNALKWLINSQGKIIDQRVFLAWANDNSPVPDPNEGTFDFFVKPVENNKVVFTNREFAQEFSKALEGYKSDLQTHSKVNFVILDSATTGRMAVLYYRNIDKELYLDRLVKWHSSCAWLHGYKKDNPFYGAPSAKEIAIAAYGPHASDKLIKGLVERILPCIVDDREIPIDVIRSAYYRTCNPVSMDWWEWEKTLSITCGMINRKESLTVALEQEINDRDYLFGRLLAVADVLETRALGKESTRQSNAMRYMNAFSRQPARTWKTIQDSLQPYQARLGDKGLYLSKLIDEVASKITFEDFNNKPLNEKYLLGFYSQRNELWQKKEKNDAQTNNSEGGK